MMRIRAGMGRTARIVAAALVALAIAPAAGADRQKDPGLREVIAAAIKSTTCFEDKYDDVVWYALMQPQVKAGVAIDGEQAIDSLTGFFDTRDQRRLESDGALL